MDEDRTPLRELLPDFRRHLRAKNLAPNTIGTYGRTAERFVDYLERARLPADAESLDVTAGGHRLIEGYVVHLQKLPNQRTGRERSAADVAKEYRQLQQFCRWLADVEEVIGRSPFDKMSPPAVPVKPVPVLTVEQLQALLRTCQSKKTFAQIRDRALIWLFIDTGVRANEMATQTLDDDDASLPHPDFDLEVLHVQGKGRRPRAVPFSPKSGEALRRYIRARRKHPRAASTSALWLGRKGALTGDGIRSILDRRAEDAGIPKIYPHMFRHTFAHRWLAAGGQEQDLMRLAGWQSREMISRYGASVADERARQAYQRMQLDQDL